MLYYMDLKSYNRVKRVFVEISIKYMNISSNANEFHLNAQKPECVSSSKQCNFFSVVDKIVLEIYFIQS